MGNCLVTKLKGSVNGDLPKVGCMRVYFHVASDYDSSKRYINVDPYNVPIDVTIEGGQFVDSNGQPLGVSVKTISESDNIYVSNDEAIVYIPKYSLGTVYQNENLRDGSVEVDVDDCAYVGTSIQYDKNLDFYPRASAKGDVAALKYTKFSTLDLSESKVTGDIGNILNNTRALTLNSTRISGTVEVSTDSLLESLNIGSTSIALNLDSLANHPLSSMEARDAKNVYGNIKWLFNDTINLIDIYNDTLIEGTVEEAVERAWNDFSKRSGMIQLSTAATSITLHGVSLGTYGSDFKVVFSANNVQVLNYFTEAVLATYNGSTWTDKDGNPYTPNS